MPFYDLICKDCDKESNIRASVAAKTEGKIPCPSCGSFALVSAYKRAPGAVIKSSGGAADCPNRHLCGEGCRH